MKAILIFSILVLVTGGFLKKTTVLAPEALADEWRGKVFYSPLKSIQENYSISDIILMKNLIKLQFSEIKFEDIRVNCLDQKKLPCNIEQFARKLTNDQAALFLQTTKAFLKKIDREVEEPDKSCCIIQIKSQKDKPLENYIICARDATTGGMLRTSLIEKYNNFMLELPVEQIPEIPMPGEEFKLFITDAIFKRTGSFYLKEDQLEDSDFKTAYSFAKIQGDGIQSCAVTIIKPKEIPNKFRSLITEDKICVLWNYNDRMNVACLADENDPFIRIMILGRALRQGCLKLGGNKPLNPPSYTKENFLTQTRAENITDGIWKGWGYLYSVQGPNIESTKPIFINLNGKTLDILKNPNSELIQKINLQTTQSSCGSFRICNYNEFLAKKKEDREIKNALENVKNWRSKTDIRTEDDCFILEINNPKNLNVICIYNPNQASNFRLAFEHASLNSTITGNVDDFEQKGEGSQFSSLVIYENKRNYAGTLKVEKEGILKESNEVMLKYEEVQAINGDKCEVLISNFDIAPALLGEQYQIECCIEVKRLGKKMALCERKYPYIAPDEDRAFENPCILSIRNLAAKIRGSCQLQIDAKSSAKLGINGAYNYNKDTDDRSNEGFWAGWIRRGYLEKGDVELLPVFLKIDKDKGVFFGQNPELNSEQYDIASIEWPCEENQLPCTVEEYGAAKKINDFTVRAMLLAKKMNIDNYKSCFILPITGGHQNFICVFDLNQETNIKLAISNAFNINIQIVEADKIPVAEANTEYSIYYYNPLLSSEKIAKSKVTLQGASLTNSDGTETMRYSELEDLLGVKCGIEFRELSLPSGILAEKFNPHCCFAFVKGKQKHFICVETQLRCCLKARMMMKRIRLNCLKGKLEIGEVSQKEYMSEIAKDSKSSSKDQTSQTKNQSSQPSENGIELVGALSGSGTVENPDAKGASLLVGAKTSFLNDPWLKSDASLGNWQGKAHFVKVEESPNFYLKHQTGLLAIDSMGFVKFAKSLDDLSSSETIKYKILSSHFYCSSPDPCSVKSFLAQRKADNIDEFTYQSLSKGIDSFMIEKRIDKPDSCFFLEFEQPLVHYFETYLVCPYDYMEEDNIKQAFRTNYDSQIEKLDLEDKDSMRDLPLISDDAKIEIKLLTDDGEIKKISVKFEPTKISNFLGKAEVLSYAGIDYVDKKCMVHDKFEMKIPNNDQELETECCVQIYFFQKPLGICPASKIRCPAMKKMIIKKLRERCSLLKKNVDVRAELLKKEDPNQAKLLNSSVTPRIRDVEDSFNFGVNRNEKPEKIDISSLAKDLIDDSVNGRWSGWVYSATLTERNPFEKLSLVYMNVDKSFLTLSNTRTDAPFLKYMTLDLKWPCTESPDPCTPSEYLKIYQDISSFSALEQLKKTIQNLIRQNASPDASKCVILEFENPKLRAVGSELICALERSQIASLKASFSSSYYNALLEADLSMFPLISSQNEVLSVKLLEEASEVSLTVFFNKQGISEKRKDDPNPISVVDYKDFDKDSEGKACAFWYKSVVLPDKGRVRDRNCCVMWKKKKPIGTNDDNSKFSGIIMCSDEKYRCLRPARMMAKKIKSDCASFYKSNKQEGFDQFGGGENNALPTSSPAGADGAGISDENNGIWKGMVGVMELGKGNNVPAIMNYLELAPGSVNTYEDERITLPDGKKAPPILELKHERVLIPCETESACTASEYFTQRESNKDLKLITQDFRREVKEFYMKMLPGAENPDEYCTIFDYYIDGSSNSTYLICSQAKPQGIRLRKALGKGYDSYMRSINQNDIPIASKQDSFFIEVYLNGAEKSKTVMAQFGKKELIDVDTSNKLIPYTDILDDNFGTKCGVWYKNIKQQPKMDSQNVDCCFLINLPQGQTTICMARNFHCTYQARMLMKSLREGCLLKDTGIELLKSRKDVISPSPASRNPKTEILGEPNQADLEAKGLLVNKAGGSSSLSGANSGANSLKDALISKAFEGGSKISKSSKFHHTTAEDLSKSDKSWNGWMMIMVLPDVDDSSIKPEIQYLKLDGDGLAFGNSPSSMPIEGYKLKEIAKVCTDSTFCRPKDYISYYEKVPKKNFDLSVLRKSVSYALDFSEKGEEYCVVGEFIKAESSFRRIFCVIGVDTKFIEEFKSILDSLYQKIMSFIDIKNINALPNGERLKLELLQKNKDPKSSVIEAIIFNDGLKKEKSEKVFNFNEVDACQICYNVGEIQGIKSDAECCSKFKLGDQETIACIDEDGNCEGKLKMLVKRTFDRCVEMNKLKPSIEPEICPEGREFLKKKLAESAGKSKGDPEKSDGKDDGSNDSGIANGLMAKSESLSGALGTSKTDEHGDKMNSKEKEKTDVANKLADVKDLVNNLGQKNSVKSEETKEGLLKTNSDGSTTLIKPDGTQIIKEKDGSTIGISPDGSMKLNQNGILSEISSDGTVIIKDPKDGSTIKLDSTGTIQKTKINKEGIMEVVKLDSSGESTVEQAKGSPSIEKDNLSSIVDRAIADPSTVSDLLTGKSIKNGLDLDFNKHASSNSGESKGAGFGKGAGGNSGSGGIKDKNSIKNNPIITTAFIGEKRPANPGSVTSNEFENQLSKYFSIAQGEVNSSDDCDRRFS